MIMIDEEATVDSAGLVWALTNTAGNPVRGFDVLVNGQKMLDVISACVIDVERAQSRNPTGRVVCHVRDSAGRFARRGGQYVTVRFFGAVEIVRRP